MANVITAADRERMLAALLLGVKKENLPDRAYEELEQLCVDELDAIEPIINEIIARESKSAAGKETV